jgi:hypothetical protein
MKCNKKWKCSECGRLHETFDDAADCKLKFVCERDSEIFEDTVNTLLSEGGWRVVQTEMSVADNHFCAMLVRCGEAFPVIRIPRNITDDVGEV